LHLGARHILPRGREQQVELIHDDDLLGCLQICQSGYAVLGYEVDAAAPQHPLLGRASAALIAVEQLCQAINKDKATCSV
jgi:hypothetical protein